MAHKAKQVPAEHIKAGEEKAHVSAGRDWKAEGMSVASQFIQLESSTDSSRWELIHKECEALANNAPSVTAFLDGFGSVYVEKYGKDTAKVRKSEVRALIEAYYIDKDKLVAFTGNWHKRVELAREIRPAKPGGKGKVEKDSITPKQAETATELTKAADAGQAATIAYAAVQRISGIKGGSLFLVNTCRAAVSRIKTDDKGIESLCQQVVELLDKIADGIKAKDDTIEQGKQMAEDQSKAGNKMLKAA